MTFKLSCTIILVALNIIAGICTLIALEYTGRLPERDKIAKVWLTITGVLIFAIWILMGLTILLDV